MWRPYGLVHEILKPKKASGYVDAERNLYYDVHIARVDIICWTGSTYLMVLEFLYVHGSYGNYWAQGTQ